MSKNFWNSCPLILNHFPTKDCTLGKKSSENSETSPECAWFLNSAEHNYCFWKYIRSKSDSEGVMELLSQNEIANLLKIRPSKINEEIDNATTKFFSNLIFKDFKKS